MTDQVNSAPLQRDRVTGSSSNGDMSTQQKLFEKVALILASKEINVEREGSISLDIDDNGNIKVIGNIKNKNEIAAELNKDEDLKSLLTAGLSDQGVVASEYSQPVDTIEVSDDAIQAYQDGVKNTPSANYESIYNLDQINNDSSIPNNSQTGDSSPLIGVVEESEIEESIPDNSVSKIPIVNGYSDLRQILGISYDNKGIEVILSTLNERILSQRSEINDLISGILEMNKIDIGDNEDFDNSLAEDGSISVKAINDDALAEKCATVIQDAFNEESEDVIELKAKLKSMTLDEMALSELSAKQNINGSTISDGLAVALIENQLGASLESIRNEDGVLSEESDTIKELVSNSPNIISALNSSTEHKSTELYGNFTLSSEVIKSDFVEDYSRSMKKHVEDNLAHNAILYNDAGVYNENEIKDLPPGLDEYLGSKNATQEKGKISFDVPPELRIESFEARINEHG